MLLSVCALALLSNLGAGRTVLSHLKTENPAVRGSDPIENNPARAFIGGPMALKDMPPQCERMVCRVPCARHPYTPCVHTASTKESRDGSRHE